MLVELIDDKYGCLLLTTPNENISMDGVDLLATRNYGCLLLLTSQNNDNSLKGLI